MPDNAKHVASPNVPVASPKSATGPNTNNQVILFWNSSSEDDHTSWHNVVGGDAIITGLMSSRSPLFVSMSSIILLLLLLLLLLVALFATDIEDDENKERNDSDIIDFDEVLSFLDFSCWTDASVSSRSVSACGIFLRLRMMSSCRLLLLLLDQCQWLMS